MHAASDGTRAPTVPQRRQWGVVADDPVRVTTLVTLGLVLVLISLGGAVRATDSGLACPDWPLCYGKVVPRQVLTLSLGADHRVTDGRLGAQFLARIAALLADPGSL